MTTVTTTTTTYKSPRKSAKKDPAKKDPATTLSVSAKVSDMFFGQLLDAQDRVIGSREGYVPAIFNDGDNDYICLDIDLLTGRIVGWKRPAPVDLYKFRQHADHLRVPRNEHTRTINIQGKTSDLFMATLLDAQGNVVGEYDGYVLACCHDGNDDYVNLDIDVDSGQIAKWKGLSAQDRAKFKAPKASMRRAA